MELQAEQREEWVMTAGSLAFGKWGEITPETVEQAGLTGAEKERALELAEAQAAYLAILDTLSYPVDPEGHVHDLSALGASKIAIAWTLALVGFRKTGPTHIKKRPVGAPGVYADACEWVDARLPDAPGFDLQPEHRSSDPHLPPSTRRLAALRDGDPGQDLSSGAWSQPVTVTTVHVEREVQ